MSDLEKNTSSSSGDPLPKRILEAARDNILARGLSGLRMEDLAARLGISKKTLYVHFPGKNAIAGAIVHMAGQRLRHRMEAILADTTRSTPDKFSSMLDVVTETLRNLSPALLRDLKENAPDVYRRIDDIRRRHIPVFWGRLLQAGIADGSIRSDIDPEFVTEFWIQAMQGLMDPDTLERTQLTPQQTLSRAVDLVFSGLLTESGRARFSRHAPKDAAPPGHAGSDQKAAPPRGSRR